VPRPITPLVPLAGPVRAGGRRCGIYAGLLQKFKHQTVRAMSVFCYDERDVLRSRVVFGLAHPEYFLVYRIIFQCPLDRLGLLSFPASFGRFCICPNTFLRSLRPLPSCRCSLQSGIFLSNLLRRPDRTRSRRLFPGPCDRFCFVPFSW